jgi:hypothetical protein
MRSLLLENWFFWLPSCTLSIPFRKEDSQHERKQTPNNCDD